MVEINTSHPLIKEFLALYPKKDWQLSLHAALVYGIKKINFRYSFPLRLDQLLDVAGLTPKKVKAQPKNKLGRTIRAVPKHSTPLKPSLLFNPNEHFDSHDFLEKVYEPKTCSAEDARKYLTCLERPSTKLKTYSTDLVEIAEDFLANPFISVFSRSTSRLGSQVKTARALRNSRGFLH